MSNANDGDTIKLAPGNYSLSFYSFSKAIRFSGAGTAGDVELINTTLTDYATGIEQQSVNSKISIHNSIISNTTTDLNVVLDGSGITYSQISDGQFTGSMGNISGTPLYADLDYHLQTGSPAIDAGDPVDDFSNEPVPSGCRVNMGAYGNTPSATASSDPDTDGDGLTDRCESLAGTSSPDGIFDLADMLLISRKVFGQIDF